MKEERKKESVSRISEMQKEKLRGKARDFIHTRIGVMRRAIVIKLSNVAVIRIETVRLMAVHFCITGETRAGGQMPHPVMLGLDGRERQRGERERASQEKDGEHTEQPLVQMFPHWQNWGPKSWLLHRARGRAAHQWCTCKHLYSF